MAARRQTTADFPPQHSALHLICDHMYGLPAVHPALPVESPTMIPGASRPGIATGGCQGLVLKVISFSGPQTATRVNRLFFHSRPHSATWMSTLLLSFFFLLVQSHLALPALPLGSAGDTQLPVGSSACCWKVARLDSRETSKTDPCTHSALRGSRCKATPLSCQSNPSRETEVALRGVTGSWALLSQAFLLRPRALRPRPWLYLLKSTTWFLGGYVSRFLFQKRY